MEQVRLSVDERTYIAGARRRGESGASIARVLGRNRSVVNRELSRNANHYSRGSQSCYEQGRRAQEETRARRRDGSTRERLKSTEVREYVETKLKLFWSPEIISNRIKMELAGSEISAEAIYLWIYEKRPELSRYLLKKRKKRENRTGRRKKRRLRIVSKVPKISIEHRPIEANERQEIGHMETDTVHSGIDGKGALLNTTDRKSRKVFLRLVKDLKAETCSDILITNTFTELEKNQLLTFTYDNGPENAAFDKVDKAFEVFSYFCHPYAASERGTVESRNGFVRRFLPKGTDFSQISDYRIQWIQEIHNNRPMKCLGFKTPNEVWEEGVLLRQAA